MKNFYNTIDSLVTESLKGFCAVHKEVITLHEQPLYVSRNQPAKSDKVALISGGGSGHEPLHIGMVGYGMLDAACPGQIFSSPTPDQIVAAAKQLKNSKGVLFLVKNYSGDLMNFEMASELLSSNHATITVADESVRPDPTTFTPVQEEQRRGLAGVIIFEKMLGALAETGADLPACVELALDLKTRIRTIGVALGDCTFPGQSSPHRIAADNIEIGIGLHGEPGRTSSQLSTADQLTELLIEQLQQDLQLRAEEEILLIVNGMGGTPLIELYLLFDSIKKICHQKGFVVSRALVGNYATSLDMAGFSITICRLIPQLKKLWDAPVHTPSLHWR